MSRLMPQQRHPALPHEPIANAQLARRRTQTTEQLALALWWSLGVAVASALVGLALAAGHLPGGEGATDWLAPALCLGSAAAHGCLALFIATIAGDTRAIVRKR